MGSIFMPRRTIAGEYFTHKYKNSFFFTKYLKFVLKNTTPYWSENFIEKGHL